jgi:hypothetical protein
LPPVHAGSEDLKQFRKTKLVKTEDFDNNFSILSESPHFLIQAATDPEHPNRWPGYPLSLQIWRYTKHKINYKCKGRAPACQSKRMS